MRVESINNTSFQMGLKINPKLNAKLQEKGIDCVNYMSKYYEKNAGIKNYNVVFEDSFYPQVKKVQDDGIDYFQALKKEELMLGKHYTRPTGYLASVITGFYPTEPKIFKKVYGLSAAQEYNKFKNLHILDQATELSKLLEKAETIKPTQTASKTAKQLDEEKIINKLLNNNE